LVTFSIYIVDAENPIIVKIFLEYRKGILGYGSEFNSSEKNIAIRDYRPLEISQP
jgi:hypothetical protein